MTISLAGHMAADAMRLMRSEADLRDFLAERLHATYPDAVTKEHPIPCDLGRPRADIVLTFGSRQYAIELKLTLNGRVPETMFDYYYDISKIEHYKRAGYVGGLAIIATSDRGLWQGRLDTGIYAPCRAPGVPVTGTIQKPTGARDDTVQVDGSYLVEWRDIPGSDFRYAAVMV